MPITALTMLRFPMRMTPKASRRLTSGFCALNASGDSSLRNGPYGLLRVSSDIPFDGFLRLLRNLSSDRSIVPIGVFNFEHLARAMLPGRLGVRVGLLRLVMKVTVEMLRWEGGENPRVLHSLTHESHSIESAAAAAQGVIDWSGLPERVDGYRLTTDSGVEFYGWPVRNR